LKHIRHNIDVKNNLISDLLMQNKNNLSPLTKITSKCVKIEDTELSGTKYRYIIVLQWFIEL